MTYSNTTTLGFIGLGSMGLPMASNMLKSELTMYLYDLEPARYASLQGSKTHQCDSPKDVANKADKMTGSKSLLVA